MRTSHKCTYAIFVLLLILGSALKSASWPFDRFNSTREGNNPSESFSFPLAQAFNLPIYSAIDGQTHINYSSPVVKSGGPNDTIFVGSLDGKVHAITSDGESIWTYQTAGSIYSAPAISETALVIGSTDGYVYCLNTTNGTLTWKTAIDATAFASPIIDGNVVYLISNRKAVTALDIATGSTIWSVPITSFGVAGSLLVGNSLVVAHHDGKVRSFNKNNGTLLWTRTLSTSIRNTPSSSGGVIYVAETGGSLSALDAVSGTVNWTVAVGEGALSAPATIQESSIPQIVITSSNGKTMSVVVTKLCPV